MTNDLELSCRCGRVRGVARDLSPRLGNRIVCYCRSCQQFPTKLGVADSVLDEYGGTDIYQLPPAHLQITEGSEHIRCLRHSEQGLYRWYAGCCNTPIANAPGPGLPFVGLIHSADAEPRRNELLGGIRAHVYSGQATKPLPADRTGGTARVFLRILFQMLSWRRSGKARPHPFFNEDGRPIATPEIR